MRKKLHKRRQAGFTLIEIMIVMLIMTILISIAIPNWMRARETSRTQSCVTNLREIESAKEQFAAETRRTVGDAVDMANVVPDYIRQNPECPSGGGYVAEPIGTNPSCPNADLGHTLN